MPATPFPKRWLHYIVVKYAVNASAVLVALYVVFEAQAVAPARSIAPALISIKAAIGLFAMVFQKRSQLCAHSRLCTGPSLRSCKRLQGHDDPPASRALSASAGDGAVCRRATIAL
jgi:hypothetical protein